MIRSYGSRTGVRPHNFRTPKGNLLRSSGLEAVVASRGAGVRDLKGDVFLV